ncbi:MAG: heparinase II/III family protein [Chthoniobacteraceae bacterium]
MNLPPSSYLGAVAAALMLLFSPAALSAQSPDTPPAGHRAATADETEVFAALDLSLPELAPVKSALDTGDYSLATHEWATYLRQRTSVPWFIDPREKGASVRGFNLKVADKAVAGTLQGGYVNLLHTFPDGKIDWAYDPTGKTPDMPPNHEWVWQLNRMMFWEDLGGAYAATGDERYAETFVNHLRSWVARWAAIPAMDDWRPGSAWRPIEAGLRMGGSWPTAYQRFLLSSSFTDADLLLFVRSCLDHGRYLQKYGVENQGNHLTMAMSGLYSVGALFPEYREAKGWRTTAVERLTREASRQFLPDGAQFELTPGYHDVALENFLKIMDVARKTGHQDEIPPALSSFVEKAYNYMLGLMTPDRSLPLFNDSWGLPSSYIYQKAVKLFPERADFRWALTDGREGEPPAVTSQFFDWAGFAVMRSGWGKNDNYLVFRVGPAGTGHIHNSLLDVVMWAWGRRLLLDNGGGSYEKSKWRDWSISTHSHNCVVVDGMGQFTPEQWAPKGHDKDPLYVSQQPIDAAWTSTPGYDYARQTYNSGYGPQRKKIAAQKREVFFLKPGIYAVRDTLQPGDASEHTYQARWQVGSTNTEYDATSGAVETQDSGVANLAIVPLVRDGMEVRSATAQEEPEILGWLVIKDNVPPRQPITTVLHTVKGTGVKRFLTLLIPLKPGEESPIRSVSGTDRIEVTFKDGRRIQINNAPDAPLTVSELN